MHELSIAEALIEQVQEIAAKERATVTAIAVSIGSFSGVDPEALDQSFKIATAGTPLAGANLDIKKVPAKLLCHSCEKESCPELPLFECQYCGSMDCEMISGRDMLLQSVELES
ncbi:MAG: hydrogenase maturation nickel metallochaperone HypA [Lentisphaerae bacterium RIFOXYA12_FULL_48_11]|nr:MAG: hydrogenase maturation nickel metallochaperone HypA [Lentisphaerae bacterium RIFOXYA12_FULL_48_11]